MLRGIASSFFLCVALSAPITSASAEPPWDGYVDSTQYPIRIHYTNSAGLAKAEQALGFAETFWQIQVEQMGFAAPSTEDATGTIIPELWVFLDPDGGLSQFQAIGDIPSTPWTDCTSRAVLSTLTPTWYLESNLYHVMNKNLLLADDCGEGLFARKSTATAVQVLINPDEPIFIEYCLPVFQSNPHYGLACFFMDQERRGYAYGAALFPLFLEDHYGDYDGTLLSGIWEAARQNGTVTVGPMGATMDVPNQPNLFDAMETVLNVATLDEAFVLFAQWRYFVGLRHDGEHFREGNHWSGGELAMESEWTIDDLPLDTEVPENLPNEYGSVYLALDLYGIDDEHGVRFALTGDPAVTWNVDVLLLLPAGTAEVQTVTVDAQGIGELTLENLTGYDQVVFIVSNLGDDGTPNPDSPLCANGVTFAYDLEQVATALPPAITSLDPTQLEIGADHHVWIYGTGLMDGAQVTFGGSGIQVTGVTFVDETTLSVDITVAPDATEGSRSMTVTNPNTLSDTLANAVTLFALDDNEGGRKKGCGCASSGNPGGLLLWVLLLGLALSRIRRRGAAAYDRAVRPCRSGEARESTHSSAAFSSAWPESAPGTASPAPGRTPRTPALPLR